MNLPLYYTDGNIRIGGGVAYPNVGLICSNCGNTQLINAIISGVIERDEASKAPPEAPNDGE